MNMDSIDPASPHHPSDFPCFPSENTETASTEAPSDEEISAPFDLISMTKEDIENLEISKNAKVLLQDESFRAIYTIDDVFKLSCNDDMQIILSNGNSLTEDNVYNMQGMISRLVVKIKALIEVSSAPDKLTFDQISLQKSITFFLLSKLSRLPTQHFDRNELEAYNNILRYIDKDYFQLDKELKERTKGLIEARENLEKIRQEICELEGWQSHFLFSSDEDFQQENELKSPGKLLEESYVKLKVLQQKEESLSEKIVQLNEDSISTRTLMLSHKIQKARLAIKMGLKKIPNKGVTGSSLLASLNGEKIGVFKPEIPIDQLGLTQSIKRMVDSTVGQISLLSTAPMAQPKGEVAAFLADVTFGFNMAPCTVMTEIENESGAFLEFLHGYQEASEILPQLESPERLFTEEEKTLFQKMTLFDFLTGNLDRHEENWMVKLDEHEEIVDIKCIDNGNCLPRQNPGMGTSSLAIKQYLWKNLNISGEKFTDASKQFILDHLTDDRLNALIAMYKEGAHGLNVDYFDDGMELLLRQRFEVLKQIPFETGPHTARELGDIQEFDAS